MAIMRTSDIRKLELSQIDEKISELEIDLGKMKSQVRSGGAPENSGKVGEIKRTLARLKTIKAQKEKESKASK
jgi:large subunit ribosomal protein L29